MLYPKYSERFNIMGQIAWRGTIPGLARTIPGGNRKRVLWNASAGAQSLFDPGLTLLKVLPQTLEWTVLSAIAMVASIVLGVSIIPAAAMLALGPIWALYYAWHAPLDKSHESFMARMLIAYHANLDDGSGSGRTERGSRSDSRTARDRAGARRANDGRRRMHSSEDGRSRA